MFQGDYTDSPMVSKYWPMFRDMGYPQCDVIFYEDGEFAFIEYMNAPLVPSLTEYKHIATGFKNIEFSESFAKRILRQIDPQYPEFWAKQITKSKGLYDERMQKESDDHAWAAKVIPQLLKNDALKERVARYGARELDPVRIAEAIAKENPAAARSLGIKVTKEHIPTGKTELLC